MQIKQERETKSAHSGTRERPNETGPQKSGRIGPEKRRAMGVSLADDDWSGLWQAAYTMFSNTVSGGRLLAPSSKAFQKGAVVNAHSGLRLRSTPVLDPEKRNVLKVIPYMTPVEVLEKTVEGHTMWTRVALKSGEQGYMYSKYLDFVAEVLPKKEKGGKKVAKGAKKAVQPKKIAVKPVKKPEKPLTWSQIVARHFGEWDKNHDGFISLSEANAALSDSRLKGREASAVAVLHEYMEELEELSNDEYFDENDGLTKKDLAEYENLKGKGKLPKELRGADYGYRAGRGKISRTRRVLFPNGVPDLNSLEQGRLGDCYFLAALGSFIKRDPKALVDMIKENKKDKKVVSYTVKFPSSLGTVTVSPPTDAEIAQYSTAGGDGLWLTVMEKAFAKAKSDKKHPDVEHEIGEGDRLGVGVSAFTSAGVDSDFLSLTRLSTTKRKLDEAFGRTKASKGKKRLVTASVMSDNELHLPKGHAYSVIGWDGTSLTIRNPWGQNPSNAPGTYTGIFKLTLEKFDDIFSEISYEEAR